VSVPGLRSSYDEVGGIVFFGRMLDKIRLQAAGRLPPGYNLGTANWNWSDARCCRFLGVDYVALAERVRAGGTDEELLDWCFAHGRRPGAEEIEVWNGFMRKRGWRDGSSEALAALKRERGFAHRGDIQTWFDFHRVDEE
jgi:hypothetical protein